MLSSFQKTNIMSTLCGLFTLLLTLRINHATQCSHNEFFKDVGPMVKISTGSIVGKYIKFFDTDVAAFFGIPYATPPIGDRRFMKAEPVQLWNGILLAQKEASSCMQYIPPIAENFVPPMNFSEDCLYLNIWAPKYRCSNFKRLPVIVWIHGGGFGLGSADTNLYDGSKLATHGEVIFVSMNYRVGPLGFLNIGNNEAPGNMGLMDQALAMEWVKQNIEFFGGDPESVTIFGESAGSWSVSLHLISPLSRNLFSRAILQSGSMYNSYLTDTPEQAKSRANALAVAAECADDSVNLNTDPEVVMKCLRTKDPITISKLDMELRSQNLAYASAGNEFLPKLPIDAYQSGEIAPVEILIGTTRDEGTILLYGSLPHLFSLQEDPKLSLEDAKKAIPRLFPELPLPLHGMIFDFYFKDISEDDTVSIVNTLQFSVGDYLFNCPVMFLAEKIDKFYLYWLTHEPFASGFHSWLGVYHGADLLYLFGPTFFPGICFSRRDKRFANDVIRKWVTFARNGYPLSDESKQQWPQFSSTENTTYELNEGKYKTIPFPRLEECKFWRSIIAPDTCSSESCFSI